MASTHKQLRVAVIGAGVSGIMTAIELQEKLGIKATLFERNEGPGGTWHINVYPGCACDVPSHWYSYSKEQNPEWTSTYATQPEIQAYWERLFHKHELEKQTRFHTKFIRADWVPERQVYVSQFEDVKDPSKKFTFESEVLVSAIGGFSTPLDKPQGMTGIETFKGECFHSARWRYDVDLKGKRVGVIGNGCSAAQFVPKISEEPTSQIVNFSRTPSWFLPRIDNRYTPTAKAMFRYTPFLQRLYRAFLVAKSDMSWFVWPLANTKIRSQAEEIAIKHIKETAPREYHDFLIPNYPIGCKRIIIDPGYLDSLNRPNVELVWDPISRVTEKGILCESGTEHELDVLILATGFDLTARGFGLEIYGSDGKSVAEQWEAQGGPQAYLGTTMSNYPNLFVLLGPNVATGHTSAVAHIECQVNYLIEVIKPMTEARSPVRSLELTAKAENDYNVWLHNRLNQTVWQGGCQSYYRMANGKIIAMWPGTFIYYWWKTRKPNFEHYVARGKDGKTLNMRLILLRRLLKRVLLYSVMGGLLPYFAWKTLKNQVQG